MLRVPVMTEDSQIYKQNVPANFIIAADQIALDGTNFIQVNLGGQTVISSQVSINELGKQLLKAAGDGNVEEVKALMAKGAAFTSDWLGTTPLHLAAQNNHLEICEILLRAGISKDAKTKVDRTPLHMAVYEGHIEIVEALLAVGADFDSKDMLLMTPLHWAAQNCHAEITELLIKYGAAADLVNKFNLTPADIAQQMGRMDIAELIMSAAHDPLLASQHLALQFAGECNSDSNISCEEGVRSDNQNVNNDEVCTPVETVLVEDDDENSQSAEVLNTENTTENSSCISPRYSPAFQEASLAESLKILQQHGITMLPSEDHNILSSAVESGHAVVLTEVGKEVLNSLKAAEEADLPKMQFREPAQSPPKKFVTISPEEFFALTGSNAANQLSVTRHANNGATTQNLKQPLKRGVMKKSKVKPITSSNQISKAAKTERPTDMETVMKQLIEARNEIEEYKVKLRKKEAEAEKYKQQLRMMMEDK